MKTVKSSPSGEKEWEKEKLLIISFSQCFPKTCKNQGLSGKGINTVKPVLETTCIKQFTALSHSLIHHFETIPNSKQLQYTNEK